MQERRRAPRVSPPIDIGIYDRKTKKRVGRLVDMSAEGIMLAGGNVLIINEIYEFRIFLPVSIYGSNELSFDAVCLWCSREPGAGEYCAGFQLCEAPPEVKDLIHLWMNKA